MTQNQETRVEYTDQQTTLPPLPKWPVSKPGPKVTQPPRGQKRMNLRTEQVVETAYNQEQGKSTIRQA